MPLTSTHKKKNKWHLLSLGVPIYIPPTLYAKNQRSYNCWERKEKMIFKENENKNK